MHDFRGRKIKLGDRVQLWRSMEGEVVCSFDDREFNAIYREKDWGYLKEGILIKLANGKLFHFNKADEDTLVIDAKEGYRR